MFEATAAADLGAEPAAAQPTAPPSDEKAERELRNLTALSRQVFPGVISRGWWRALENAQVPPAPLAWLWVSGSASRLFSLELAIYPAPVLGSSSRSPSISE